MKNIFIFGSGRSGTSMLSGVFSEAGYHMGENLYPARSTNPKGFFESAEINYLNEDIIRQNFKSSLNFIVNDKYNRQLKKGQLWLANFKYGKKIKSTESLDDRIKNELVKTPFCYKDPRFCYTYPVWKALARDHVNLVIFRHPSKTLESIVKEINAQPYLKSYQINSRKLQLLWINQYKNAIKNCGENSLFIHYDQVFSENKLQELENFTQCNQITKFAESALDRSTGVFPIDNLEVIAVYKDLCRLANYTIK